MLDVFPKVDPQNGAGLIEACLLAALVALSTMVAMSGVGAQINSGLNTAAGGINATCGADTKKKCVMGN